MPARKQIWVKCSTCSKLRRLPGATEEQKAQIDETTWTCGHNIFDPANADCSLPQVTPPKRVQKEAAMYIKAKAPVRRAPTPKPLEVKPTTFVAAPPRPRMPPVAFSPPVAPLAAFGGQMWPAPYPVQSFSEGFLAGSSFTANFTRAVNRAVPEGTTVPLSRPAPYPGPESKTELTEETAPSRQLQWVQCDLCNKWRRLVGLTPVEFAQVEKRQTWNCLMNIWDPERNSCAAPEENSTVSPEPDKLASQFSPHTSAFTKQVALDVAARRPFNAVLLHWAAMLASAAKSGISGDLLRELAALWCLVGEDGGQPRFRAGTESFLKHAHLTHVKDACSAVDAEAILKQFDAPEAVGKSESLEPVVRFGLMALRENPTFVASVASTSLIRLLAPVQFTGIFSAIASFQAASVPENLPWLSLPAHHYVNVTASPAEADSARVGLVKEQYVARLPPGCKLVLSNDGGSTHVLGPDTTSIEVLPAGPFLPLAEKRRLPVDTETNDTISTLLAAARAVPMSAQPGFVVQLESSRGGGATKTLMVAPASAMTSDDDFRRGRELLAGAPSKRLRRSLAEVSDQPVFVTVEPKDDAQEPDKLRFSPARELLGGDLSRSLEAYTNWVLLRCVRRLSIAVRAEAQSLK